MRLNYSALAIAFLLGAMGVVAYATFKEHKALGAYNRCLQIEQPGFRPGALIAIQPIADRACAPLYEHLR